MDTIIAIRDLNKSYYRDSLEIPVLFNITMDIQRGEFLALMGPSGSGKTTLLNLIAGIDQPNSGSIMVDGTDVPTLGEAELASWRAQHVGFVFQFYNLLPELTSLVKVALPLPPASLSRRERREHVEAALSVVGLEDRMGHYPRQLSGGQEQRVAIARAIVTDPTIIVADEPTGDLDRRSAEEILTLLDTLNSVNGKTIVMVTHDPRAAERAHVQRHLEKGELL